MLAQLREKPYLDPQLLNNLAKVVAETEIKKKMNDFTAQESADWREAVLSYGRNWKKVAAAVRSKSIRKCKYRGKQFRKSI